MMRCHRMRDHAWRQILSFSTVALLVGAGQARPQRAPTRVAERLAELISNTSAVARGSFGFKVVDVETGGVVAEQNAGHFYTPASNAKLYTTAAAMVRLGPNYRYETEVRTSGAWMPGQAAVPDLQLIGSGDPNLSGRVLPYQVDARDGDPLAALKDLADQIAAAGIHDVIGDVIGVATRYPGDLYPDGWTLDDSLYYYGAPVSALALNDNSVSLTVRSTLQGELACVEVKPSVTHLIINNQVVTDAATKTQVHLTRAPGSNEITLWGSTGVQASSSTWQQDVAVADPALFAAQALVFVLRTRGITVHGEARALYRDLNDIVDAQQGPAVRPVVPGRVLAVHESGPLWQAIQVVNKESQNLHSEMLLREVGYVTRGVGTLQAGVEARQSFLAEAGVLEEISGYSLGDGSGLARQDLTTPESTVALLRYMWQRPERDLWLQSLPIGGVDGSLEHRFKKVSGADRVHAKTGSISHVNALSGYIQTKDHGWLAFSAMVNATNGHSSDVVRFLDEFCALFLE